MVDPPKHRRLDEPVAVSLEDLVPRDHFYRHLEAKLDLSFVHEWASELYADRGRPSIDPVVFFKLQLVMFFEGIRSERKLVETASLHLARRWYLGYALDEPLPDHSSSTASATSIAARRTIPCRRYAVKRTEGVVAYRGEAAVCNACRVKARCTTSDHGRKVQRSFHIDYLERVRGYHATEAYRKAIRKRQVWVEPIFAEAKEWHGLRRLRLRGLLNANIQGPLVAAGQNLKRFLAAAGWGRRHAPCGSLVALRREARRPAVVSA